MTTVAKAAMQTGAVVALYGISVAGYVVLNIWGQATAEYVALVGPVIAAAYISPRLGAQDQVLDTIAENTNGVLTKRIKDAVREALEGRTDDVS